MVRPHARLKRRGEVLPWCLWRECSREGGRNAPHKVVGQILCAHASPPAAPRRGSTVVGRHRTCAQPRRCHHHPGSRDRLSGGDHLGTRWGSVVHNIDNNSIGRITTSGVVTNYTGTGIDDPEGITRPGRSLWFTNSGNNSIGRITTSGVVTKYTGKGIDHPQDITSGPDGALWFTNSGNNSIGRITTTGVVTNTPAPASTSGGITSARTARSGSPTSATTRSDASPPRGRHQLHRHGINEPEGHHGRPGRRALVHQPRATTRSGASPLRGRTNYTGPSIDYPAGITVGARRRPVVHQLRQQLDRAHHHGRRRHELHRYRHQRSARDHGGARRRAVVHQLHRQLDRAHHHCRGRHQLHRPRHRRPRGDHRGTRRSALVHEPWQQHHRADHHHRRRDQLHRHRHRGSAGITAGPDGALWFTNYGNNSIGRITTAGGRDQLHRHGHRSSEWDHRQARTARSGSPTPATTRSGASPLPGVVTNYTGTGITDPTGITAGRTARCGSPTA